MSDEIAIKIENVSKTFMLPHEKNNSIKGAVVNFYKRNKSYETQEVLKDVSFEIKKGEFFGIVGRNGSGKSTLLKLIAGIYSPSKGAINVNGKLTPFIELGVGFNPELTGRENVFMNGALLGFNRKEMLGLYDEIVEFAELEKFMDQKLKNYSSGMQVRLAFSIAIQAQSDILVLDEVLAVGDAIFQKKCYDHFKTLKKNKKTVVFVSHDAGALQEYCDKGILIDSGKLVYEGAIDKVVNTYLEIINNAEEKQASNSNKSENSRWGTGEIRINEVVISGTLDEHQSIFKEEETILVDVEFEAKKALESPVYGVTVTDASGQIVFQSNTLWCEQKTKDVLSGQKVKVHWEIPNVFNTGTYHFSPGVSDSIGSVTYEWLEEAATIKVRKKQKSHGFVNTQHKLEVSYE